MLAVPLSSFQSWDRLVSKNYKQSVEGLCPKGQAWDGLWPVHLCIVLEKAPGTDRALSRHPWVVRKADCSKTRWASGFSSLKSGADWILMHQYMRYLFILMPMADMAN